MKDKNTPSTPNPATAEPEKKKSKKNTPSTPTHTTAALIHQLNQEREWQGMTMGEVALIAGKVPNLGYKFFDVYRNPKVDTLVEYAAVLGFRLELVPIVAKTEIKPKPKRKDSIDVQIECAESDIEFLEKAIKRDSERFNAANSSVKKIEIREAIDEAVVDLARTKAKLARLCKGGNATHLVTVVQAVEL